MNASPLTLSTSQWVQSSSHWSFIAQEENGTDRDLQWSHHTWIPAFAENVVLEMLTISCRATFTNYMNSGPKTSEKNNFLHLGSHIPFSFPQCLQQSKEHLSPLLSTLAVWREVPSSMSNPPTKSHISALPEICTKPGQLVLPSFRRHLKKILPHSNLNIFSPLVVYQILPTRAELQYICVDSKERKWLVKNKPNILLKSLSDVKMSS